MASSKRCCVPNCNVTRYNDNTTLHSFPNAVEEADRFRRWMYAIGGDILALDNQLIYKHRKVCHKHFETKYQTWTKRLSPDAIPTLHLSDVTLHDFPNPAKFPQQFERWVQVAGEKLKLNNPKEIYRKKKVCHVHFTKKDWNRNNRINALAVPSLHIPGQKHNNSTKIYEDVTSNSKELRDFLNDHSKKNNEISQEHNNSTKIQEDVTSNSKELKDFLNDHTYSLLQCPRYVEKIGDPAKEDSKTDLNVKGEDAINDQCDDDDDHAENYDDNNTPLLEVEISPQELFSWEKTDVIVADSTDMMLGQTVEAAEMTLNLGDVSMYNDEKPTKDYDTDGESSEYRCNECGNKIKGFRYTCVHCADWDLCAACEARGAHDAHYVLRVPGQRPYKEMQAVLAAIRNQMLREDMFLPEMIASIKEELKDEGVEVPEGTPEPGDDPLGAWNVCQYDGGCDTLEIYPERRNEDGRLPRKRRKTSLDSSANTQTLTPRDDSSSSNQATVTDDVLMLSNKDATRSDDNQTLNPKLDYSEPVEIIDVNKLIKTHEQTEQNDNDTIQRTKEISNKMSLDRFVSPKDGILDTRKPHSKREKLIDMNSPKTPLKTFKPTSHAQDDTHSVRIGTQSKEIGTDGKRIETHNEGIARHRGIGAHNKGTGTHSIANANGEIKKRYRILLPPGAHWKQFLITMLKSRVTVQLEDVMRKRKCKKSEINEI